MSNFISIKPFSYEKPSDMKMSEYLCGLQEFKELDSKECKEDEFFLNHQKIIARFMSPYTPFHNILIIHDVGTGKSGVVSCVFEEFFKFYEFEFNFVYLSNNEVTRNNFFAEFMKLSPTMNKLKNIIQVNENMMEKFGPKYRKKIRITDFNIFISKYSNMYLTKLEKKIKKKENVTILFIDEVHNLVQSNNNYGSGGGKDTEKVDRLLRFIKSFPNRKVIYLTGTPMRHTEMELLPLLSFVSDKPISYDLFDSSDWENKLEDVLHSVNVSYFRSRQNKEVEMIYKKGDSSLANFNKNMFYNVYFQSMDGYQSDVYLEQLFSKNMKQSCMDDRLLHRHAIVVKEEELIQRLNLCQTVAHKMSILKKYSIIFYKILQKMQNHPDEKIFIYCKYINFAGTNIFCKVLEAFGKKKGIDFIKLSTVNHCSQCNQARKKCICSSNIFTNSNIKELVDLFNNTESMKIIIGSDNHSEGLSFFDIEQIHILSPWWNYGKMKQVCGRGNRLNSHLKLISRKKRQMLKSYLYDIYKKLNTNKLDFHQFLQDYCERYTNINQSSNQISPVCLDEDSQIEFILQKNNFDLEKLGLNNTIEIKIKVYLHCAMPNLKEFSEKKKKYLPCNEESDTVPVDFYHDILQYKKYISSSNHEDKIKHVLFLIYKNSIDYHLNMENNKIKHNDIYFKNMQNIQNIQNTDESVVQTMVSKTNYLDIFHYTAKTIHGQVLECIKTLFKDSCGSISIFVQDVMVYITAHTNLHETEIAYNILHLISKRFPILNMDGEMRYMAFKNNYLYLYSDQSYQDIFLLDTNEYLPLFQSKFSVGLSSTKKNIPYNLETIKEKLNVKRKLSEISKDLNIEVEDIEKEKRTLSLQNMNCSTKNLIEVLPKKFRQKLCIENSFKKNFKKKEILEKLFQDKKFMDLYFASQKNIIGIDLTVSKKFLIYIFHTFDFSLDENESKSIKERIFKLIHSINNNHMSSIIKKTFRHQNENNEISWNQKYDIILQIMQQYEKDMEFQLFKIPWENALYHLQSIFKSNKHLKLFGWKKIFNIFSHSFRNKIIRIDGMEISIDKHFEYSIWIHLQMIQNHENKLTASQKEKWNLFCREFICDKRMDSTGRNISTLYFQMLYDIFQNYFSMDDIIDMREDISSFDKFLKENKSKSQRIKHLKISKWRNFLMQLLHQKKMVWTFDA